MIRPMSFLVRLYVPGMKIMPKCPGPPAVVADGGDDFPDILTGPHQPRPSAGRALGEPDERMLIHAQALFDVPLGQGPRGKMRPLGVPAQARDSRIVQAEAKRMTHVVRRATYSIPC
jgi:hypothetical protein